MDHQAFAQLLGNYGEFLGAIAVVATLGYLAAQIRQNTKTVQSSTLQASTDSMIGIVLTMATDPNLLRILSSQSTTPYAELSSEDRARYHFIMLAIFRAREALYLQAKYGTTDEASLSRYQSSLRSNLQGEYLREWWQSAGQNNFSPEFYSHIADLMREAETSTGDGQK